MFSWMMQMMQTAQSAQAIASLVFVLLPNPCLVAMLHGGLLCISLQRRHLTFHRPRQ